MQTYLLFAEIFLAAALMLAILLQVKGGSGLGGIFGQAESAYRTKRGVEKTLFQLTIVLAVLFVIVSIITLKVGR
ncbi:MAG: preprotein translocase subunit SecG [Chloroflexi bacterium RBG_16_51_9]|nr:MAG: preprotein translocase subunit SecG [Chloroflexi bacterium RBG_16_51_9]